MASIVDVPAASSLEEFDAHAHLRGHVAALREIAAVARERIGNRRIWMVNSTARGGGVAEMMPTMITLLRDLGFRAEWAVIDTELDAFFDLTKQIHNLIHGAGSPELPPGSRELFELENRRNAAELAEHMSDGDLLAVHDPQPIPLAGILRETLELPTVWRCHIGLDEDLPQTRAAWDFLQPYADAYDRAVFTATDYIPDYFRDRAEIITPALDPLGPKSMELRFHKVVEILANSGLTVKPGPMVQPPFDDLVQRLQGDGQYRSAALWDDIGLLTRPIFTQVSRWDRLKGFRPLIDAFVHMKTEAAANAGEDDSWSFRRRLSLARLVLAGPDPSSIQDDPEGQEVLQELHDTYLALPPEMQDDVALITLPMSSRRKNALIVNALQRASSVIVQNSIREGFGLTVTEGMWKGIPVLTNSKACGTRQQIVDGVHGRLVADPENIEELAAAMMDMMVDEERRDVWGRNAQRRVHEEFLVFHQVGRWLEVLAEVA
jgi:trehalose synthase